MEDDKKELDEFLQSFLDEQDKHSPLDIQSVKDTSRVTRLAVFHQIVDGIMDRLAEIEKNIVKLEDDLDTIEREIRKYRIWIISMFFILLFELGFLTVLLTYYVIK